MLCATSADAQISSNNPSQILQQYRSFRTTWITNIWPYANTLFALLAVIEFAWSAAVMALEKTDLQSWTSALIRKIMWLGAFYALLLYGRQWIPAIIDSFSQLGGSAAGINGNQGLSPSDAFTQGLNIAAALMDAASSSAFFTNPGTCLAVMLAAALVVIAFIAVTIQYIVAVVESYLVVSAGVIFLGFGGSRWTTPYVERYIGLGVSTGVKIMILYMLIGVGMSLSGGWLNEAAGIGTSPNPSMTGFDVMGAALIFMMLCWQVPKVFAAVLGGSPALSGGDLVSAGTTVVAGAATVASLGAGKIAAAAGGAAARSGGAGTSSSAAGGGASSTVASVGGGRERREAPEEAACPHHQAHRLDLRPVGARGSPTRRATVPLPLRPLRLARRPSPMAQGVSIFRATDHRIQGRPGARPFRNLLLNAQYSLPLAGTLSRVPGLKENGRRRVLQHIRSPCR